MAAHDDAHDATGTAAAPLTVQEAPAVAAEAPPAEAEDAPAPDTAHTDALPEGAAQDAAPEPSADEPLAAEGDTADVAADATADKGLSPAQTAQRLAELFPALFGPEPKPIKLKIQADLQVRAPGVFQRRSLSWFLSRHTTTNAYLKALLQHSTRFDLDGQPAGEISAEHRQAAEEELARRRAIAQAKRQAARAPQGPARGPRQAQPGQHAGDTVQPGDAATHAADPPEPAAGSPAEAAGARRAGGSPQGRGQPPGEHRERGPRRDGRGPSAQAPEQRPPRRPDHRPAHAHGQAQVQGQGQGRQRPPQHRHDANRQRAPQAAQGGPHHDNPSRAPGAQAPAMPQDPAQRDRWQLLRAWESTSLSKSNFCALKRLTEADFDAQIAQARQERGAARGG
jgi:sRNA-binding protein